MLKIKSNAADSYAKVTLEMHIRSPFGKSSFTGETGIVKIQST